jgi:hypothetical protein
LAFEERHPSPGSYLASCFGIIGDGDVERALAHMDKGTGGSKPKSSPISEEVEVCKRGMGLGI